MPKKINSGTMGQVTAGRKGNRTDSIKDNWREIRSNDLPTEDYPKDSENWREIRPSSQSTLSYKKADKSIPNKKQYVPKSK